MSWSKFRYEQSKKKKGTSKGKAKDLKEMRFSPFTGEADIAHKLKKIRGFLEKKHAVKLTIRVRGRVQYETTKNQLDHIISFLKDEYEMESHPRREGRNLSITVFPKKAKKPTTQIEESNNEQSNKETTVEPKEKIEDRKVIKKTTTKKKVTAKRKTKKEVKKKKSM